VVPADLADVENFEKVDCIPVTSATIFVPTDLLARGVDREEFGLTIIQALVGV
jgi:hypothetical protein